MSDKCIFCTLYENRTNVIYETDRVFALMDRYPLASGHLMVIPKVHRSYFHLYTLEELSDVFEVVKYLVEKFGFKEYNLLQNNGNHQSIFHVHFHIIPSISDSERLKIDWETISISDEEYAKRVREAKAKVSTNN